jgi:hypothetical protein
MARGFFLPTMYEGEKRKKKEIVEKSRKVW